MTKLNGYWYITMPNFKQSQINFPLFPLFIWLEVVGSKGSERMFLGWIFGNFKYIKFKK